LRRLGPRCARRRPRAERDSQGNAAVWATDLQAITDAALKEASTYGVEAMDALHVAAAALVGATELVTAEKPTRSLHRARSVAIVSIHEPRGP
jgi:predicted nucleic acid-binding protein